MSTTTAEPVAPRIGLPGRATPRQGILFQQLRWRLVRNAGALLFGNSRLRFISMITCSALIWSFVFAGAWYGFREMTIASTGMIAGTLFDAMFFTLGGMLFLSTGLITYASLFTGAEAKFLLTTPARSDQIFASKFQSAVAFSSWGFIVLGGPILIAFGVVFRLPWHYYLMLPAWLIGFVIMTGAAGAISSIAIVNFVPQRRKQALIGVLGVAALAVGYWIFKLLLIARESFHARDAIEKVFAMFTLASTPISPSRWVSRGLVAQAADDFAAALLPLCLLWSNALLLYVIAAYAAKKLYRRGFNRMSQGGGSRRTYGSHWLDQVMDFLVGYLDPKTRLLIVKDFRTFRREPAQVGQLVLFAGLMLLCVINIRQFFGVNLPAMNQSIVSLLNVTATGLLMCAYLGRFIYPLISLEGRKFWVLGLLPLKRDQLLWGKFAFAVTMTYVLAGAIILISDLVMEMPLVAIALHQATIAALSVGLSGLSVGLSAWMPNFRETDPSKIVVGFGGTMFTIVSVFYLAVSIVVISVPYHVIVGHDGILYSASDLPSWVFLGVPIGAGLAFAAVHFPMRIGAQTLREMEF